MFVMNDVCAPAVGMPSAAMAVGPHPAASTPKRFI